MSWENAYKYVSNKPANLPSRVAPKTKAVITEKNFDVHINARHGIAFLKYLKKMNPKLWKILADNGRNLNILNDNQKKYLLCLFNEFRVNYGKAVRRIHAKQAANNPDYS